MAKKRAEANKRFNQITSDAFEMYARLDWRDGDNASH
jgi:hypothetical protein